MTINRMDLKVAIAPQLWPEDLATIRNAGYHAVINNRPDGEEKGQPPSAELEAAAHRLGLIYRHIPIAPGRMTDEDARAFAAALAAAHGPVVAFCRSGSRSAALWKRSRQLGGQPTDAQG